MTKPDHPDLTQPHGAPDQKARVLEWLRTEPGGLTQLQALQHLAVARLAAVVYRLREDDGVPITTELVEMPTRYGPATVARYHLADPATRPTAQRAPVYACAVCCDQGKVMDGRRSDGQPFAVPCPAAGCAARAGKGHAHGVTPDGTTPVRDDGRYCYTVPAGQVQGGRPLDDAVPGTLRVNGQTPDDWQRARQERAERIRREAFGE